MKRKPKVLNPPERIFLQVGEIDGDCEFDACNGGEDVTWAQDRMFDTDVEYRLVKRRHKSIPQRGPD